jgi:hypothetical protein
MCVIKCTPTADERRKSMEVLELNNKWIGSVLSRRCYESAHAVPVTLYVIEWGILSRT